MEEIKKQIEKLEEELKALKDKLEDTANDEWKPNIFVGYYYVDLDSMGVCDDSWGNTGTDNARLNHKVIFKTEEKAEEYLEYLEEKEKHMNTFTEEEWKSGKIDKFFYYYETDDCEIKSDATWTCRYIRPYFKTEKEVKDFIEKYEWQIKHELGVN